MSIEYGLSIDRSLSLASDKLLVSIKGGLRVDRELIEGIILRATLNHRYLFNRLYYVS